MTKQGASVGAGQPGAQLNTIRGSAQYDPPINRAAYCPDALYVIDDLVGNGRRVGGRQDRLGITEADVIVAAASHEIAGRDRIGFVWIERRMADLDR